MAGSVLYVSYKAVLIEGSEARLINWTNRIILEIAKNPRLFYANPEAFLFSSSASEFTASGIMVQFMDVRGHLLAKSPSLQLNELPFQQEDHTVIRDVEFEDGICIKTYQTKILLNRHMMGHVIVGITTTHLYSNLAHLQVILAFVLGGTCLVLGAGIWMMVSLNVIRNQRLFLTFASHELRTPLSIILGHAEVALRTIQPPDSYQQTLQIITEEAQWMNRLIQNLLAVFRTRSGTEKLTMAPCNVVDIVTQSMSTLKRLYPHKILTLHVYAKGEMVGDRDRLMQVVDNLLLNAATHTDPHGNIILTVSEGDRSTLILRVQDDGCGISKHDQRHIFDLFYRAQNTTSIGTGLGLALAKWIVKAHGGTIGVESHLGKGSVFCVQIPR